MKLLIYGDSFVADADWLWLKCVFGSEWRSLKLNGFVQSFPSDRVPAEMPPWCSWKPALHFPFLDFFFIWPCLKNTRCPVLKFDVELTLLSLVFLSSDTSKTHRRLKEAQPCSPQGSNAEPEVCFHTFLFCSAHWNLSLFHPLMQLWAMWLQHWLVYQVDWDPVKEVALALSLEDFEHLMTRKHFANSFYAALCFPVLPAN